MSKLRLETARLVIRDFRESDWPDVVRRTSSPVVTRYLSWDCARDADKETVLAWIREQRTFDLSVRDRYLEFAVMLEGRNIGDVGFRRSGHTPDLAEVGWIFEEAVQGQGYATEAAAALIDWVFCHLRVRRVIAVCDARNEASYRLMERLGLRREAHHKKSRLLKGVWIDELIYAVLEEEWTRREAPAYRVLEPFTPSSEHEKDKDFA